MLFLSLTVSTAKSPLKSSKLCEDGGLLDEKAPQISLISYTSYISYVSYIKYIIRKINGG